jgi:hypothetical protein
MAKGNNQKGNREAKKPKKDKTKPAVSVASSTRDTTTIAGKKVN